MAKVSNCCGVLAWSNGDGTLEDYWLCSKCKEHCEYVEDWERDADISLSLYGKNDVTVKSETNTDLSKYAEDLFTRFKLLDPKESKETLDKITAKIKS